MLQENISPPDSSGFFCRSHSRHGGSCGCQWSAAWAIRAGESIVWLRPGTEPCKVNLDRSTSERQAKWYWKTSVVRFLNMTLTPAKTRQGDDETRSIDHQHFVGQGTILGQWFQLVHATLYGNDNDNTWFWKLMMILQDDTLIYFNLLFHTLLIFISYVFFDIQYIYIYTCWYTFWYTLLLRSKNAEFLGLTTADKWLFNQGIRQAQMTFQPRHSSGLVLRAMKPTPAFRMLMIRRINTSVHLEGHVTMFYLTAPDKHLSQEIMEICWQGWDMVILTQTHLSPSSRLRFAQLLWAKEIQPTYKGKQGMSIINEPNSTKGSWQTASNLKDPKDSWKQCFSSATTPQMLVIAKLKVLGTINGQYQWPC